MALSFDNCLTQAIDGINYLYGDCCCDIQCTVTVTDSITIDDLSYFFSMESFYLTSNPKIYIDGNPQTLPLSLNSGDTFDIQMNICASPVGNTDNLQLKFNTSLGVEWFYFDFEALDLSSTISPSSFSFGNTVIETIKTLGFQLQNPTICCYEYTVTTDCPDMVVSPSPSNLLCTGDKQNNFKIDWNPLTIGTLSCNLTVTMDCQTLIIPINGRAINAPSGGGERVEQKNKVDQTTRVEACSPRTANNRCQTAQTMQNAIRTNARRFGKR